MRATGFGALIFRTGFLGGNYSILIMEPGRPFVILPTPIFGFFVILWGFDMLGFGA